MEIEDCKMIRDAARRHGFEVAEFYEHEDNGLTGKLGRFRVIEGDDDRGLYEGDEGELEACIVGAVKHNNQRVSFGFTPDGYDSADEVWDFDLLEQI